MEHLQLLQKRGIDAKYTEYIGGPPINESMLAGRSQVGFEGNFPFTTLLVKQFPVVDLAVLSPNLLHCVVVPNDSPYKSVKDWANQKTPLSVGVLIGSSPEFYFQDAARSNGVEVGKDVTLVNIPVATRSRCRAALQASSPGMSIHGEASRIFSVAEPSRSRAVVKHGTMLCAAPG